MKHPRANRMLLDINLFWSTHQDLNLDYKFRRIVCDPLHYKLIVSDALIQLSYYEISASQDYLAHLASNKAKEITQYLMDVHVGELKCEVGVLTVIKGVGELRYNTFTKQEVMHVFLWVQSKFNISSYGVNPFQLDSCTKHKYFYIFTPKTG